MSIELMNMVWKRFPGGSGETLLALSIADHARDDGTRIWPSVGLLATKSRMDERSVRRYLRKFEATTWLLLVRKATGRPGDTNEYRINPDWIDGKDLPKETGDNLSPVSEPVTDGETGDSVSPVSAVDNVIHTGDIDDRTGDIGDRRGDTRVPRISMNHQEPNTPPPPAEAGACGQQANPETPKPVPKLRTRDERNWQATKRGVDWMASELGMEAWKPGEYGIGEHERYLAFERRVVAEFERRAGGGRAA